MTQGAELPVQETESISRNTREHVLVSWSVQSKVKPLPISDAQGVWMWDASGRKILDFSSQLVNLNAGHKHPKIIKAIQEQAEKLCYIGPNFANEARAELAAMLAEKAPGDLCRVLFTTGGAEANENAIKAVRLATGKRKIITRYRAYHGATSGAMSLGGDNRRWANEPGIDGIVRVHDPYCYRCPFKQTPGNCNLACVENIEEVIWYEGTDQIAAIFVEGLTGTNGIFVNPPGYLTALRALCDKYGILLVVDEVMTGFGRTGKWFAVDHENVVPDIITFAKGINSGYVPLGGVIMNKKLSDFFDDHMFWGGLTYSGHPLACAAGIANMKVYEEEGLIENSARLGSVLLSELKTVAEKHPSVGDVRGQGLFCGIELVKNKETKEPLTRWNSPIAGIAADLSKELMSLGAYVYCRWNMIFVTPPLVINEEELRYGVSLIDKALAIADAAATAN
jgi:taurine---2-oxoglutarate transaminase